MSGSTTGPTNRLARESSPYLLLHAHNPVDWYPWGEEAIDAARREDKPIFLSVGYSTCYWCHVMERESFSDPEIARADERAASSTSRSTARSGRTSTRLYMAATQILAGQGGWPNSVFLTPDLEPFYAGTYFPPGGPPRPARVPDRAARADRRLARTGATTCAVQAGERGAGDAAGARGALRPGRAGRRRRTRCSPPS